jgi:ferric-dicitrate binding protein FerR (iron transport regulator)
MNKNNLSIIFALLMLLSFKVIASQGTIVYFKGEVLLKGKDNSFKRVNKGQVVALGDMIRTKQNSIAVIALKSGSKVKLNANSAITIKAELTKKKPEKLFLNSGSVFISVLKRVVNKDTKSKVKLLLKTRSASMGVRGTQFFASFGKQKDQSKRKDLWMCVNEGLVLIKTNKSKKAILVKAGEGVHVKEGTDVSAPRPLEWTKKLNWELDSTKGDLTNKVSIEQAYTDLLDKDYD